jgi:hypothetical protein
MAKISNKDRYLLQTPITPDSYFVLTNPITGKTEHVTISQLETEDILQNNTIPQFNTIKATGAGIAAAVVAFNGTDYLDVLATEIINVAVQRSETRQTETKTNQVYLLDYYWLKSGKGTYGLNGANTIVAGDLLYRRTNEVISIETIDNLPPVVYDAFALDVESDSIASYVNAQVSASLIDANADYFFIFIEVLSLITDEGVTGNYKYYRFIGADGNYGSGQDQAVNGDFIELTQNDIDLQTQASLLGLPDVHENTYVGKHGYVWEAYENTDVEPATRGSRLVRTSTLPNPSLEELIPDTYLPSTTGNFILKGSYFTEDMTIVIEGHTYNYIEFVNSGFVRINMITNAIDGFYDVTLNNGGDDVVFDDVLQIANGTVYEPSSLDWENITGGLNVTEGSTPKIPVFNSTATGRWKQEFDFTKDFTIQFKVKRSPLGSFLSGEQFFLNLSNVSDGSNNFRLTIRKDASSTTLTNRVESDSDVISYVSFSGLYQGIDIPSSFDLMALALFEFKHIDGIMYLYMNGVLYTTFTHTLTENLKLNVDLKTFDVSEIKYIDLDDGSGDLDLRDRTSQLKNDGENGVDPFITASDINRLNDVGNVATAQVIDWSAFETWDYIQTAAVTFTEIGTPPIGFTKTITVYISGNFTPVIPASWLVKSGAYDGAKENQYVVEWVKSGKVWAHINN